MRDTPEFVKFAFSVHGFNGVYLSVCSNKEMEKLLTRKWRNLGRNMYSGESNKWL